MAAADRRDRLARAAASRTPRARAPCAPSPRAAAPTPPAPPSTAPRSTIACDARLDPRVELVRRRASSPTSSVGSARRRRPQPVLGGRERRAGLGQLERADDAAAVVRVHACGGGRVALGEERVRRLGPELVVARRSSARARPARAAAAARASRAPRGSRARCRRRRSACGRPRAISSIAACASRGTRRPTPPRSSGTIADEPRRVVGRRGDAPGCPA